ncbi:MAG: DUF169 domain-containing protein [Gemmatimonadales bacterium]|jgi:uncharacterized protein (DUF169 family)
MNAQFQKEFQRKWKKYFPGAELPVAYFYTDEVSAKDAKDSRDEDHCIIAAFDRVRRGHTFVYHKDSPGCPGWARHTGFSQRLSPTFEYFLSYGIPGEVEGERYKKTPELARAHTENHPGFEAPGKYMVIKRWDKFAEAEEPFGVIFFATPDVLSGLFALANYDRSDPHGVIAPMGSGCASIVLYVWEEAHTEAPRCVLGMFDVSARPQVRQGRLTFAMPFRRLEQMVANMDESFLITGSWKKVRGRIKQAAA